MGTAEYARTVSETWREGLEEWGQSGARIQKLRDAAEFKIFTPGSRAGTPLTVLRSFSAPPKGIADDPELMAERVEAAVSGLLALLGIEADPLQSREHILLSKLLEHHWSRGENLELSDLLFGIQKPPFERVGFFDVESFYPEKDRFALSMRLNNLLASPGFQVWMEGETLDIPSLLYAPDGRPRVSVLSIAHLEEAERMFFVTILLNELLSWMRGQPGTSSLRAILYMDEIFGYFPPNANPPSKRPMLTLLKQARAYGVGCMLATQNPVDLDYKGLSNTGTWLIGRLQTERDKLRVLDGLEGASGEGGFDRAEMDRILSGLGSRRFLLHNVHESGPVVFQTRWAMSYLRGPLTRDQIRTLCHHDEVSAPPAVPAPLVSSPQVQFQKQERPVLPARIDQAWYPFQRPIENAVYRPALFAMVRLHYVRASVNMDTWENVQLRLPLPDGLPVLDWEAMSLLDPVSKLPAAEPIAGRYEDVPASALVSKNYTAWKKEIASQLYQTLGRNRYVCKALKLESMEAEAEAEFRGRVRHAARELRDQAVESLRQKYTSKFSTQRDRIQRAEDRVEIETSQHSQQRLSSALSLGTTLLGAFLGRKKVSTTTINRAGTAMRRASRSGKEKDDVGRAEDRLAVAIERLEELEVALEADIRELEMQYEPDALTVDTIHIPPRKSDIQFAWFGLCWFAE